MKRLIRKSDNDQKNVNMIKLKELDENDVKFDRCPICGHEPLKRKEGFKHCESCNTTFKHFDSDAFIVAEKD